MSDQALEERMRRLERFRTLRIRRGAWPVVRLDGRSFHRFTEGRFEKPFDARFRDLMVTTARALMEELHAVYAYTMSDEISLLMPRDWGFFGRRVEKIASVTAGMASAALTDACGSAAHFDSRIWVGQSMADVIDYFAWRQADAARNALNAWCFWTLRAAGHSAGEVVRMLDGQDAGFQRRQLAAHGVDPDSLPMWQGRGVGLYWEAYEKLGYDPTQDKEVIATRHRILVDHDLPSGEDYARLLRGLIAGTHGAAVRRILHVDMDAFFASIEQKRRPELRGQPVVVGGSGDPRSRAVVSTASYQARPFGIHSGMPLALAYRRCPQAVFLPVDFDTYAEISRQIMAILRGFSPKVEPLGLDEAFLDVSHAEEAPESIARAIKARIMAKTGLTCSVGVAPNKLLAKIASDMDKPDGLTVITAEDVETRIWPLPVRQIWGIGPKTEERLAELGVRTIGELAALGRKELVAQFGPAHGDYFHEAAHGIDDSPVVSHHLRKSLGRETTFERDCGDPAELRRVLGRLAEEVAEEAQAHGLRWRTVTVKLRYADFVTVTRRTTLPRAAASAATLRRAASDCLARIPLDRKVRLLGVRVSKLERPARQISARPSQIADLPAPRATGRQRRQT